MSRSQTRRGFHVPVFLALLGIVAGLAVFIVALPLTAQSPEPSADSPGPLSESAAHADALAIYDADGDGGIDVDEFLAAVDDHLAGRIDKAQARRVMELHLGGTLADVAAGAVALSADKDWARIACHWLGCGPLVPTATPTDTPVPGPPFPPTVEPTEEPTVPPPVEPTVEPTVTSTPTYTPTPIPPTPTPLRNPCGYYDFNKNGQIDKSEVQTAIAHHKAGNLNRSSMLAVVACYLSTPAPTPTPTNTPGTPEPTATNTPGTAPAPAPPPGVSPTAIATVSPTPLPRPGSVYTVNMIGDRGVRLHWTEVSGATGYSVKVTYGTTEILSRTYGEDVFEASFDNLTRGKEYVFMVAALNGSTEGIYLGEKRKVPQPKHWLGHQADQTVKYAISPNLLNNIVYDEIGPAVTDWNRELQGLTVDLVICASCKIQNTDKSRNTDKHQVVVTTINKENDSVGKAPKDLSKGCGKSVACVKPAGGATNSPGPGKHIGNLLLVLEDPPRSARKVQDDPEDWERTNWKWTKKKDKHNKLVSCPKANPPTANCPPVRYMYVKSVLIHEFGHTMGLHDFYGDITMDHLNAVMNRSDAIQNEDKLQLKAIYRSHKRDAH